MSRRYNVTITTNSGLSYDCRVKSETNPENSAREIIENLKEFQIFETGPKRHSIIRTSQIESVSYVEIE